MKAYTNIEQSKKLAEILPLESADMYWWHNGQRYFIETKEHNDFQKSDISAWSLAALLEQIPERLFDNDGFSYDLEIAKEKGMYYIDYTNDDCDGERYYPVSVGCMNTLVDACYELILKLHEQNIL